MITVLGLHEAEKLLDGFTGKDLRNAERRAVRAAANAFKPEIVAAARGRHGSGSGNVPASFAKVPAAKVSAHLGADVSASIRPKSPLFNIFEPGAGAHVIAPRRKGQLAGPAGPGGWTKDGRKRRADFYAHGAVRHPGMSARPILPGAFSAGSERAVDAAAAAIFGTDRGFALGTG
jgi:hypothetical protein